MDLLSYLRRLFAYDAWANHQTLTSVRAATADGRSIQLLAHVIAAGLLWHARLTNEKPPIAVWPALSPEECTETSALLERTWDSYLHSITPADLASTISYKNSKGESWTNNVADVLMHVAMHGAYHRGQIAAAVRASGQTPAYTDFIEAVRRNCLG